MSPALRRIRAIRWTTTGVFAITTAACLAVLVVLALRIDSSSRLRSLQDGLADQASVLGEVITFTDGSLDLSRLQQTQNLRIAPVVGVVTADQIAYASPDQSALPDDAELLRVVRQVTDHPGVTSFLAPQVSGTVLHWAAAPVIGVTAQGVGVHAAVLVGGPVPGAAEHARLTVGLTVTGLALVLVAAVLGHVISGFAMRPAVRGLADQERFLVEASTSCAPRSRCSRWSSTRPGPAGAATKRSARLDDRWTGSRRSPRHCCCARGPAPAPRG